MTCPNCAKADLTREYHHETMDFDTGRGILHVHVKRVPVEVCPACGHVQSGPLAAGRRTDAILRATLALLHRLVPASVQQARTAIEVRGPWDDGKFLIEEPQSREITVEPKQIVLPEDEEMDPDTLTFLRDLNNRRPQI